MSGQDLANSLANSDVRSCLEEARAAYVHRRPRSAALHQQARAVMPGGNTRSVLSYGPFPTAMARGQDCRLWDVDGHEYLDLCGEYTAGLFGHSEARIHAAVAGAMAGGLNLAAVGEPEVALARILCDRFAAIELVRFTNSGTEANLMALTAARAYTGRDAVLAFRGGYHGGVLTFPVTDAAGSRVNAPYPFVLAEYNDTDGAVALIRRHAATLAAVIVEPMLGSGGCIPARPGFLAALREAAGEAGALLILDEVMTSRMSAGGQQARAGVVPDLTTLGKYVAGGMSFGAFGGRADVMDLFAGALPHAGTFNNNVLSMAAGRVAMGEIFTADAADALYHRGEAMRAALNAACAGTAMHFTGLGSMAVPHFRAGPVERPYVATAAEDGLRELFFLDMLAAGLYLARRGMVALSLPVGAAELDRFTGAVREFVQGRGALLR